jgi:hypothetical protein
MLESTPHDVYHLPGYGPLYESDPRAEESALWVRFEDAELLMPLMLRPLPDTYDSSLPGARDATSPWGYPGPLLRGTISPTELEGFANCVITALADHRIATCFIRTNPLLPDGEALLGQLGVSVDQGAIALIELDRSKEEIWRGYDGERRRRVLRLREAGFVVRHDEWEDFEAFRTIYRATMQRVAASSFYMFDDAHFERLRNLLGPRLHLVCVVSPDGQVAAAALNTECHGVVNGHLSGTSSTYKKYSPSLLIYDGGWRWAKSRGNRVFNFGGGLGAQSDSLFKFKQSFATATRPFRTIRVVCDEGLYRRACSLAGVADDRTDFFPPYRRPPLR